jgi:ATP:corrinoid adenosyltransferase
MGTNYGGLDKQKALQILKNRPPNLHIAITGRDASDKLIAAADLVTEMKESKHPFNAGIKAQKGIEF